MNNKLLSFDSVEIQFDNEPVISDLNFSLEEGEILGLVGESGSGKTTIIKSAMRLLNEGGRVTHGDICFRGDSILNKSEKDMRKLRGNGMGMIFQDTASSLCPIRTIGSQILESMGAHGRKEKMKAREKAFELFEKLNFRDANKIWNSYPFELSGGMNQRVGIAIAMLMNPPLLLADEPTSALDVAVQKQVIEEMLRLRDLFGTAIIIVTHDIGVVSAMADNVLVLKNGQMMEYGRTVDILNNPQSDYTKQLLAAVPRLS